MALKIEQLKLKLVDTDETIINDLSLKISPGEVHVLMGPNGSGKSSLAKAMTAHPDYEITSGAVTIDGEDTTELETAEIAAEGLFLAHQYPVEIPGLNLSQFIRMAYNSLYPEDKMSVRKFRQYLRPLLQQVGLGEEFLDRNLNDGFSGGEKKKCEILQLLALKPKYALLDETDSGLDIDATKIIFTALAELVQERNELGLLIVTHYMKVLEYINPDYIHVLINGKLVASEKGNKLADIIADKGYSYFSGKA